MRLRERGAGGAYTQRARIRTRVRIRGWVRLRERWVPCVYAAGAYMHPGVYTRVGAFTRAVGVCVYTGGALLRTPSRIHWFLRIRTPDRVYAGIDEP